MHLIRPSYQIMNINATTQFIKMCGKVCYKSEDSITLGSSIEFTRRLLKMGHESVIEHSSITVKFIIDRGVSHELVRHRLCSFSQESTRYCNYAKKGVAFVIPPWLNIEPGEYQLRGIYYQDIWFCHMLKCERVYTNLINQGITPQQARSVLPNSLKTEIIVTANLREWRHILKLRTSKVAHPQMQEIMIPLLNDLQSRIPVLFGDIKND